MLWHRSPLMFFLVQETTRHGGNTGSARRSSASKRGNSGGMTGSNRSSIEYSWQSISRIIRKSIDEKLEHFTSLQEPGWVFKDLKITEFLTKPEAELVVP